MSTRRATIHVDTRPLAEAERDRRGMSPDAIVEEALRPLIARDVAERLAELGGTAPDASAPRRRWGDEAP